jgi:hypothetical protein
MTGNLTRVARRFEAFVFDWDGTAVPDRSADASEGRRLVEGLCAAGASVAIVSGTHLGNVDGQLRARPAPPGRLVLALNRGSEVFAVRVTPTEERRAVNRVDDPDPIGLTELTKFLTEERIFWPRRRQRLAKQSLDCPVGFRDWCAVGLQRCRNARLEVSEREVRRQVRGVEREL